VFGYAVGEMIWDEGATLRAIRWHDPRRFAFEADDWGAVTGLRLLDAGTVYPVERFLLYTHGGRFGNPYGESDLVAAYRPWATKDQLRRMWLSALDRFGAPVPVARVPRTWDQSEMDALSTTLGKLQNESALVVPEDVTVDVSLDAGRVEPARAFVTAIEYEDTQIARAILGQELTTQGASRGAGSYALGRVHQGVADDWIQSLRASLADRLLTAQLSARITAQHHPTAPVPRITFPNLAPSELAARRELIASLVAGNVVAPDEGWVRRYLGLPERGS
jgi:phage gp29-like protein